MTTVLGGIAVFVLGILVGLILPCFEDKIGQWLDFFGLKLNIRFHSNPLIRYLPETMERVVEQLEKDYLRWGDEWRKRPQIASFGWPDQEARIGERVLDYYEAWENGGTPIPWEKIIGLAHIALMREHHPEFISPRWKEGTGPSAGPPADSLQ